MHIIHTLVQVDTIAILKCVSNNARALARLIVRSVDTAFHVVTAVVIRAELVWVVIVLSHVGTNAGIVDDHTDELDATVDTCVTVAWVGHNWCDAIVPAVAAVGACVSSWTWVLAASIVDIGQTKATE
jgi:hypothetical protein